MVTYQTCVIFTTQQVVKLNPGAQTVTSERKPTFVILNVCIVMSGIDFTQQQH